MLDKPCPICNRLDSIHQTVQYRGVDVIYCPTIPELNGWFALSYSTFETFKEWVRRSQPSGSHLW